MKKIWQRTLVSYSREVADAADRKVYVAADITTSGKMMAPAGEMTYEAAFEMYQEQIRILKDSGVDLIIAETMINIEETLAAVDAASCKSKNQSIAVRSHHISCHMHSCPDP